MDGNLNVAGNAFFKRCYLIDKIAGLEADKILHLIVDDFAIAYIAGLNFETLTDREYTLKTGILFKPPPLSDTIKFQIYQKIFLVFEQRLKQLIVGYIRSHVEYKYYCLDIKKLEKLLSPTLFPFPNFAYRNIISQFYHYVHQNYSFDSTFIISAVEYEKAKFLPDIYKLAQLNEILHEL